MVETTLVSSAINSINDRRNSDAINVAVNIGLLTKDKKTFTISKFGFRGERNLTDEAQQFKLYDTKTKRTLFWLELLPDSSPSIVTFIRGGWETILETCVRENDKNNDSKKEAQPVLKLRHRTRKPKGGTTK